MQIKGNLYNNALTQTSKNSKNKRDDENKVNVAETVSLGAVGGGLLGAALGWIRADQKTTSITLTVKKPVYQFTEIGKIPNEIGAATGGVIGGIVSTILNKLSESEK